MIETSSVPTSSAFISTLEIVATHDGEFLKKWEVEEDRISSIQRSIPDFQLLSLLTMVSF